MESKNNVLRAINLMTGKGMSEEELSRSEKRINIIQENQKYTGLSDYPDIEKSLKSISESVSYWADNKKSNLANLLSGLGCAKTLLEMNIEKLKKEYDLEGEKIKQILKNI